MSTRPTDPSEISKRLDEVFGRLTNEEVVGRLAQVGQGVSKDTVRRYRGGSAERITADFCADVALAFGADLRWLLLGEGALDGGVALPIGAATRKGVDFDSMMEEMRVVLRDQSVAPSMRALLLDTIGGNLRSAALLEEGFNAGSRIAAIRENEANGKHRTDVIAQVEESAKARVLELRQADQPAAPRRGKEPPPSIEEMREAIDAAFPTEDEERDRRAGGNHG